jgi:hypothetical protein
MSVITITLAVATNSLIHYVPLTNKRDTMKNILYLAMLTLLISAVAFAQDPPGGSALSTAVFNVETALLVEGNEDLDWGILAPGTDYTITADGSITPLRADGDAEVEPLLWTITGQPGGRVLLNFSLPGYFEGVDDLARVAYSTSPTSAGWAGAEFGVGEPYIPIDPRASNTINLNADGEAAVQLGGKLSVPINATDQDYLGQFLLTVAYTPF